MLTTPVKYASLLFCEELNRAGRDTKSTEGYFLLNQSQHSPRQGLGPMSRRLSALRETKGINQWMSPTSANAFFVLWSQVVKNEDLSREISVALISRGRSIFNWDLTPLFFKFRLADMLKALFNRVLADSTGTISIISTIKNDK